SNADGRLKPEMFVRAVVSSQVAAEGKIIDPELADKHICPMHPEVVKDDLSTCDLCGMDLVSATSLG
ncbi:MAG: efflux transporter periplasmic adaptor subunit, partial [Xanthomonadales bacterium]|nr:efflux transporter periplasmic adaptor subunit [Xanthomonadales bacterium]NIX13344.1 efflux transporter periplasmic adaptor subunit [Xanthomonadales bacterium]